MKTLALLGPILAAAASKDTDPQGQANPYKYGVLGRREPAIAPGQVYAPSDPLTIGDGLSIMDKIASMRIAPAWFPYGGGQIRQGTDYTNAGTFKQFYAAAEGLSLQGDGRRFIGTNAAPVGDLVGTSFAFDEVPLSIGFLVRFGTNGTNVNPLAGQQIEITTNNWVTPWAQSAAANNNKTPPDRNVVISLDVDGLGKPLFVPWATENFQRVRTTLAYAGVFSDDPVAAVPPSIVTSFPVGLAAVSPFQIELVTCDHPDLDRIIENLAMDLAASA